MPPRKSEIDPRKLQELQGILRELDTIMRRKEIERAVGISINDLSSLSNPVKRPISLTKFNRMFPKLKGLADKHGLGKLDTIRLPTTVCYLYYYYSSKNTVSVAKISFELIFSNTEW